MLSEVTKILKFNQYQNSDKAPFIIYEDFECLIEKTVGCKNDPNNSSTTKAGGHIPSGSMFPISSFKSVENKHDVYRDKDCMKTFRESLREYAMNISILKRKKTKGQQDHMKMQKSVEFVKKNLRINMLEKML